MVNKTALLDFLNSGLLLHCHIYYKAIAPILPYKALHKALHEALHEVSTHECSTYEGSTYKGSAYEGSAYKGFT